MLDGIARLQTRANAPLSDYTRFGIGGPARLYAETPDQEAFIRALRAVQRSGEPFVVIGGGTNLIVSDDGFDGIVLRYTADRVSGEGRMVTAEAGAELQALVDYSIDHELAGIHTMTRIPGSVGGAVYGNAGAYGNSISTYIRQVRYFDGESLRTTDNAGCYFKYRDSIFKRHKDWIILSTTLELNDASGNEEVARRATEIRNIRDQKYPPTMKCAGSIFKNLLFRELPIGAQRVVPERSVIEGKVPSAWFLEQVGAKGIRNGGIHVADYHANLIYNAGGGTARELREVIFDLKWRVRERFGFDLEEEVQYVGYPEASA